MASHAAPVQQASVPPDLVGNAFVHQYYLILHQSPELVHRFYQDVSKLGRLDENGIMTTTTTMHAINEKILSVGYGEYRAEITTVDSQESYNRGVLVLVTGYLTGSDNLRQKFTQSFFLAPHDKGYFVLNDVFRYVDDDEQQNRIINVVNSVEAPVISNLDAPHVQDDHVSEQTTVLSDEADGGEVCDPPKNGDGSMEEEEMPVPETVDEITDDSEMAIGSQIVAESNDKVEDLPKKSYASIVKVLKENASPFSNPSPSPLRSAPKSQEQVAAAVTSSGTNVSSSNANENGNVQDGEVEGPSIYVKNLPLDATPSLLENEFKKFGSIRAGGIQVRCQKGFCFGFVEFEVGSAVQSAIEASPIMIHGCRVVVEEKRSTSRGNHRGRFSSGAGAGYRNDGARGRGNFGGRAYGRGDFSNRAEYGNRNGNRGGFSNRGGDGFRRADRMGNNGSRVSRAGGLALNGAVGNTVSATA